MQSRAGSGDRDRSASPRAACCRFLRARGGVVGLEMALLALPLLALVVAVLELALVIIVAGSLDEATGGAARDAGMAASELSALELAGAICGVMPAVVGDCASRLDVAFERLPPSPGQAAVVIVRASYRWPLVTPLIGRVMAGADGALVFRATSAYRRDAA